jgi:cupin 2 domain-containing protein
MPTPTPKTRFFMQNTPSNLFSDTVIEPGTEQFLPLLETDCTRIERILSNAHASPGGFWYDQPGDEWVVVLKGNATLEFDPGGPRSLAEGDHLFIPRHTRHRVTETSPDTVWLAVHLKACE